MANPHPSKYLQHVEDDCKRGKGRVLLVRTQLDTETACDDIRVANLLNTPVGKLAGLSSLRRAASNLVSG